MTMLSLCNPPVSATRALVSLCSQKTSSRHTRAPPLRVLASSTQSSHPPSKISRPPGLNSALPYNHKAQTYNEKIASPQQSKRSKELEDRTGYLRNVWYAVALSEKVTEMPMKVQLCGTEMVLFRDKNTNAVHCIDNTCPHRGAPLSEGWVSEKNEKTCIVCPYHGWAFDGDGILRDVPATDNKGEWPKRPLSDSYIIEEKGGFLWLFFGSPSIPPEECPPIPYIEELDHPEWKAVYEEMTFECNHFAVFENSWDFAHIHYLHADSFGNQDEPAIHDMHAMHDDYTVDATLSIKNKPVNAFWSLFQVPFVRVTAKAFLPSTSMVSFTLGNKLSFITFVNVVPISEHRSINRFALIRNLKWDSSGLFNSSIWDGIARKSMIKILGEDRAMVEQLRYDLLMNECSVKADLPQMYFRKIRQQWADLCGVVPSSSAAVVPPLSKCNGGGGGGSNFGG